MISRIFVAFISACIPMYAQAVFHLEQKEIDQALEIALSSGAFENIVGEQNDDRRPIVSSTGYIAEDSNSKVVKLVQFDYGSGKEIHYVVDLEKKELTSGKAFEARSPKLTEFEEEYSITLSQEQVGEVKELFESSENPENISVIAMPTAIADRNDARFGKRITLLRFRDTQDTNRKNLLVEVNLTNRTARLKPPTPEPKGAEPLPKNNPEEAPPKKDNAQIIQKFPVNGSSVSNETTTWRIDYALERSNGTGEVLVIKRADFKRSSEEDWIQVLGDCRLAEMFVPYHSGTPRFYDIAMGFSLEEITPEHLGPECVGPSEILENKIAKELHDNHVLWLDAFGNSKRVEELHLWSVYSAGNYRYIMLFVFRDDGQIDFRVGATAHNFHDDIAESASHQHIGVWRISVPLGDSKNTEVKQVRHLASESLGVRSDTQILDFNHGSEGGIPWLAEEHTTIRFVSKTFQNSHEPKRPIAYDVISKRFGNTRTFGEGEEWTHSDFWVTQKNGLDGLPLFDVREVPSLLPSKRSIEGEEVVLWHQSGLVHRARTEDFGPVGYVGYEGVALTSWAEFSLKPRDFFSKSPFYVPDEVQSDN